MKYPHDAHASAVAGRGWDSSSRVHFLRDPHLRFVRTKSRAATAANTTISSTNAVRITLVSQYGPMRREEPATTIP